LLDLYRHGAVPQEDAMCEVPTVVRPWIHYRHDRFFPRSRAGVVFFLGEYGDAAAAARRLFGRRLIPSDYAGLAGAPDDALVEVGTLADALYIELSGPPKQGYRAFYRVRQAQRSLVILSEGFHVFRPHLQGRGLGLRVFARQLGHARRLDVSRIELVAGRRSYENGYYTWPRFGFDGPLAPSLKQNLPTGLSRAQCVLDLMECQAGRRWWKEHGVTVPLTFDLTRHSRSWEVFGRYVRERKGVRAEVVEEWGLCPFRKGLSSGAAGRDISTS